MTRKTLQIERVDTDVLVVGAGTGGMMAAIGAADKGARVILCEKGNVKRSGGIRGGNDHFRCYIPYIHGPALRERFLRADVWSTDADTEERLLDLSYDVLKRWESWGIDMKWQGHYHFVLHAWPGTTGKMGEPGKTTSPWLHFSDYKLSTKLEKQVRKRNVTIMNRVMVNELIKDASGRVVGAIGISTREPKLIVFGVKSVVYNTGGISPTRLYPPPQVIDYSIAEPETADGDMMAYRAGAALEGAEFSDRHVGLNFGPFYGQGSWIGVIRDSEGKPIAPPYLTKPDTELGDVSATNKAAHDHVWATGKGPVWMDTKQLSEEDEKYMIWGLDSQAMQPVTKWMEREKLNFRNTRFEFAPTQPRVHLKTRVDINFRTAVEGLYSTYKGGLARSAISGMIAGEGAAEYSRKFESPDLGKHRNQISKFKRQYEDVLNREGPQFADWHEVQWAIYQVMQWYALPSRRSESTLTAGYNHLLRLRENTRQILKAGNQHELYHCLEVLNLLDVAEMVFLAVMERKESRGEARRLDYPFINPMLDNKFLVITRKNGKPSLKWEQRVPG
jgi:succinate dehydrogenase/fumarate reductase flavoprotein subunit